MVEVDEKPAISFESPPTKEELDRLIGTHYGLIMACCAKWAKLGRSLGRTVEDLAGEMVLHCYHIREKITVKKVVNIDSKPATREEALQIAFSALIPRAIANKLSNYFRDWTRCNRDEHFKRSGSEEASDRIQVIISREADPIDEAIGNETAAELVPQRAELDRLEAEAQVKYASKLHVDRHPGEQSLLFLSWFQKEKSMGGRSPERVGRLLGIQPGCVRRCLAEVKRKKGVPDSLEERIQSYRARIEKKRPDREWDEPDPLRIPAPAPTIPKGEGVSNEGGRDVMKLTTAQWLEQNPPEPGQPVDAKAMAAATGIGLNSVQRAIHKAGYFHAGSIPYYRSLAAQKRRQSEPVAIEPGTSDQVASEPVTDQNPIPVPAPIVPAQRKRQRGKKKPATWWGRVVDAFHRIVAPFLPGKKRTRSRRKAKAG